MWVIGVIVKGAVSIDLGQPLLYNVLIIKALIPLSYHIPHNDIFHIFKFLVKLLPQPSMSLESRLFLAQIFIL